MGQNKTLSMVVDLGQLTWEFTTSFQHQSFPLKTTALGFPSTCHLQLLEEYEQEEISRLLNEFPDVVDSPLGRIKGFKHSINLIDERPKDSVRIQCPRSTV